MRPIKFADIKELLLKELSERAKTTCGEGFTLVEGFFNSPMQTELSNNLTIDGPSVPMIAVVDNNTGGMHFFALKALIPNIEELYGKQVQAK